MPILVAGLGLAAALLAIPVLGFTWSEWVTAFLTVRASAGAARRAADPDTLRGAVAKAKRAVADSPIAEHFPGAWGGRAEPVLIPRVKPEGPPRETPDPTRPSRPHHHARGHHGRGGNPRADAPRGLHDRRHPQRQVPAVR